MQAVIFDFGGVLVRTHSRSGRHAWAARLGLAPDALEELFFNSPEGRAAQCGNISEAAHWQALAERFGLNPAQRAELERDFWAGDRLDTRLIAYIDALRPTVRTAIISNAMDGLRRDLADRWGILNSFDLVTVSAEFGRMKPDAAIYEHTIAQLGIAPHEAVFVDDFAHNIAGARAAGLAAIHYPPSMTTDDLINALSALGINPPGEGN